MTVDFWDADNFLSGDIHTLCLIKYNGLALGVYEQPSPPVSHITSSTL